MIPVAMPSIAFQPIIVLPGDSLFVIGYEALLRHPRLSPAAVFRRAEETDLSVMADLAAVGAALALAPDNGRLFLNLTTTTLQAALQGERLPITLDRGEIVWEIPERRTTPGFADELMREDVGRLRQVLGGEIALDDVWDARDAALILRLGPDWVKLDRALVAGCAESVPQQEAIRSLAAAAHAAGARVIAEGVEHSHDFAYLRGLGVHAVQGWIVQTSATEQVK